MGDALIREGGAVLKSAEADSRAMLTWGHKAMKANVAAWHALIASRSPAEALAAHGRLWQDHLKLLQDHGPRMRKTFWKTALHRPDADV
jgi:hypothetical protein